MVIHKASEIIAHLEEGGMIRPKGSANDFEVMNFIELILSPEILAHVMEYPYSYELIPLDILKYN